MLPEIVVLLALVAMSAFFSGAEIALLSISEIKVRKLVRQRKRGAAALRKLKQNPHRLLVTILILNNVANIAAASLATVIFTEVFGSSGVGIATGVMTFIILVFGDLTPKSFGYHNAEKVSLAVAGPVYMLSKIMYPAVVLTEMLSAGILGIFGRRASKPGITEDEIRAALSMGAEAGAIEKDEEKMIHKIFEFGDTRVSEIMTPMRSVVSIRADQKLGEVLTKVLESRYSRIPVYGKKSGDVIGAVHIKSMLKYLKRMQFDAKVESFISPVIHVKESQKLDALMDDFRERGVHMAIVVDGKKRMKGIVTLEDLLEEIVGEIYDESDVKKAKLRVLDDKSMVAEGETALSDLSRATGMEFGRGDLKTIGDLIVSELGRLPRKGDCVRMKNFRIVVKDAGKERIKRIVIVKSRGRISRR